MRMYVCILILRCLCTFCHEIIVIILCVMWYIGLISKGEEKNVSQKIREKKN